MTIYDEWNERRLEESAVATQQRIANNLAPIPEHLKTCDSSVRYTKQLEEECTNALLNRKDKHDANTRAGC